jgi:hypothetical protein
MSSSLARNHEDFGFGCKLHNAARASGIDSGLDVRFVRETRALSRC